MFKVQGSKLSFLLLSFLRPPRHQFVGNAQMIEHARHAGREFAVHWVFVQGSRFDVQGSRFKVVVSFTLVPPPTAPPVCWERPDDRARSPRWPGVRRSLGFCSAFMFRCSRFKVQSCRFFYSRSSAHRATSLLGTPR